MKTQYDYNLRLVKIGEALAKIVHLKCNKHHSFDDLSIEVICKSFREELELLNSLPLK